MVPDPNFKKRLLILLLVLLILPSKGFGQLWQLKRYEGSVGLGTTQFYGDIGGYSKGKNLLGIKDLTFHNTSFNFTANLKYRILEDVSLRFNLALGYFHSVDIVGTNDWRGFESKTLFFEPSFIGEYYFIKNKRENSAVFTRGSRNPLQSIISLLDCYVFTGIGGLSYKVNPNAKLETYATKLSGFTPVIPLGLGLKISYIPNLSFGLEVGSRFTFSDYIDGYTSVYSKSKDVYHLLNVNITYKINTGPKGGPQFRKNRSSF